MSAWVKVDGAGGNTNDDEDEEDEQDQHPKGASNEELEYNIKTRIEPTLRLDWQQSEHVKKKQDQDAEGDS